MGRATKLLASAQEAVAQQIEAEVETEVMSFRPDEIPAEVWETIQENGKLATERLHAILSSPKFMRYRPGDQAKLIKLAQDRAYGLPKSGNTQSSGKRSGIARDVTQHELNALVAKATLPEYKLTRATIEDAEELD